MKITGTITDETNAPLPGTVVYLTDAAGIKSVTNPAASAATDAAGKYTINYTGSLGLLGTHVAAKAFGADRQVKPIANTVNFKINTGEGNAGIEEVVISATKLPKKRKYLPYIVGSSILLVAISLYIAYK